MSEDCILTFSRFCSTLAFGKSIPTPS